MADELYTLAEIARIIDIPESTCRYYHGKFSEFLPAIGKGKRKKYRQESVNILRFISDNLRNGSTLAEVNELLSKQFQKVIDITATTATLQQYKNLPEVLPSNQLVDVAAIQPLIQQLKEALTAISVYKSGNNEIKEELRQLRQKLQQSQQQEKELIEARSVISKARSELEKMVDIKQESDRKAKVLLDQQVALEEKEKELEALKAENERLKRPFWKRLLSK
jgi:DNA-binding transcriptional MerR regulator